MNNGKLIRSDFIKTVPVLLLAFYLAFIPHLSYPYPVHIDEWSHQAFATELMENQGTSDITDPFTGEKPQWNQKMELGFHFYWGFFQEITGIPWQVTIRYFPAILFVLTVLSVYLLGSRFGCGWQAALVASLIPTVIGTLGPGFLVPVALGMLLVMQALIIVSNLHGWQSYVLILLIVSCLIFTHAATAAVLLMLVAPFVLFGIFKHRKMALVMVAVIIIPVILAYLWVPGLVVNTFQDIFTQQPLPAYVNLPKDFEVFGYIPTLLYPLGIFAIFSNRRDDTSYSLAMGSLILLVMVVIFVRFHFGIALIYLRGFLFLELMMALIAGFGLQWLSRLLFPRRITIPFVNKFVLEKSRVILSVLLIVLILVIAIPQRHQIPYYRIIDREDYAAFQWIAENTDNGYEKAILDPWKANTFSVITGRLVYSRVIMTSDEKDDIAYRFLDEACLNTELMLEEGISIVYTGGICENPELIRVREDVYLLPATRTNSE